MTNQNTFPPLISGASIDLLGNKQLYGNFIIDSLMIRPKEGDLFFRPGLGLTGFGYDGREYIGGQYTTGIASWANEAMSTTRGYKTPFPENALVLLTEASLSILDASDMSMWMIFLRRDMGPFPSNVGDPSDLQTYVDASYFPYKLSYYQGRILIHMGAEKASSTKGSLVCVLDFVSDQAGFLQAKVDSLLTIDPDATNGYLGDEIIWVSEKLQPQRDGYGQILVAPSTLENPLGATGTWSIPGYTQPGGTSADPLFEIKAVLFVDNEEDSAQAVKTLGNGTWTTVAGSGYTGVVDPQAGIPTSRKRWGWRIVNKVSGITLWDSGVGEGGAVQTGLGGDGVNGIFEDSICIYHQALLAAALTPLHATMGDELRKVVYFLMRSQNSNGSWPWVVRKTNGLNPHPAYFSTRLTALVCYVLGYFLQYGVTGTPAGIQTEIRNGLKAGLSFLSSHLNLDGSLDGGQGFLDSDGSLQGGDRLEGDLEASIWAYFAYNKAEDITLDGTAGYPTKATGLQNWITANTGSAVTLEEVALSALFLKKIGSTGTTTLLETHLPNLALGDGSYARTPGGDRDLMGCHFLSLALMRIRTGTNAWQILQQDLLTHRTTLGGWAHSPWTEGSGCEDWPSWGTQAAAVLANLSHHRTNFLA